MINPGSVATTSFVRPDSQLVIYVFIQDTAGFVRKIRWENGWTSSTEPPLFKAKAGGPFTATSWYGGNAQHVRLYYFDESGIFSEYCLDGETWQHGSSLPQ